MNNQKPSIENAQFKDLMRNFWDEDVFRNKTLSQIYKDFALCGIILKLESLEQCSNAEQLESLINHSIKSKNIDHILYIVDLNKIVKSNTENLAFTIITRVAFKVFLRTYFDSEYRS